jgi:subtilase family serine protease
VYRSQFGLPPCTTANGCFKKVNQSGVQGSYPRANVGWSEEEALDLDMASATCPNCQIILVEANSASTADLGASVDTAVALGANVVSNSYGGGENGAAAADVHYTHPGVSITVSSGDNGFGVEYPASSPHVTAVGGTSLHRSGNSFSETAWAGAGSGCSGVFAKPAWQTDTGCANRTVADVSAVADPQTGVAVYWTNHNKGGWLVFGGTSVAAPLVAGVYALAGDGAGADKAYAHKSSLHDVTSGSNGNCGGTYLCTAGPGYDGPTGLGTPNGTGAF